MFSPCLSLALAPLPSPALALSPPAPSPPFPSPSLRRPRLTTYPRTSRAGPSRKPGSPQPAMAVTSPALKSTRLTRWPSHSLCVCVSQNDPERECFCRSVALPVSFSACADARPCPSCLYMRTTACVRVSVRVLCIREHRKSVLNGQRQEHLTQRTFEPLPAADNPSQHSP